MKRRQFVFIAATCGILSGCEVLPNIVKPATPQVARVRILGYAAENSDAIAGVKQGLADLGYVDGQNVVFKQRDAGGNAALYPDLANELVRLPVDVIVTFGSAPTPAARQATTAIPIVFASVTDPVGQGLVASLDHPGGNITGVTSAPATVSQKELQLLAQLVPGLTRVATISSNADPGAALRLQAITIAMNTMRVQLRSLAVRSPEDVEPALAEALAWQAEAMMIFTAPAQIRNALPRLADFEVQNRIPLACDATEAVQAGGLLFYGTNNNGMGRAAATLVDKIIKGARPADLPVEQPTVFDLIVNQTTAQALGITIPPEVAQQVTEWFQ